jgi:hypothetical protein
VGATVLAAGVPLVALGTAPFDVALDAALEAVAPGAFADATAFLAATGCWVGKAAEAAASSLSSSTTPCDVVGVAGAALVVLSSTVDEAAVGS